MYWPEPCRVVMVVGALEQPLYNALHCATDTGYEALSPKQPTVNGAVSVTG